MAQAQQTTFSTTIPIEDIGKISLSTLDNRINTELNIQQQRGFDLLSAVFVPGGVVPAHFRLFFIRQ